MKTTTTKPTGDMVRQFAGGPTSAAKMNKRTGRAENSRYTYVEGGKRISWVSLFRSVDQAADLCIRGYNVGKRLSAASQ